MKKFFLLAVLFSAMLTVTTASAQGGPGGGDPAQMRKMMIERTKPQLLEKTKITDAEADKVMDIYFASMQQRREIRMDNSLSDEDRAKKMAVINEELSKKYKAIPLKEEQVKAVGEFFEEMRKNMQNRRQGGN